MSDPTPPAQVLRIPKEEAIDGAPSGEELPPLPDGGLSVVMPSWLQQAPSRPTRARTPETVDFTSLTSGIEVPEWLSELSRRVESGNAPHSSEERPLAEAVVEHAPEVGDPEVAFTDPDRERGPVNLVEGTESDATVAVTDRGVAVGASQPAPAFRFHVRTDTRAVAESAVAKADAALLHQHRSETVDTRTPPVTEPTRSTGAMILLLVVLIALATAGIWYYLM
jgi:hypothetical protein